MIKISKGKHELEVTEGAYNSMYKRLGYKKVTASKKTVTEPAKAETTKAAAKTSKGE